MTEPQDLYLVLDLTPGDAQRLREVLAAAVASQPIATVLLKSNDPKGLNAGLAKDLIGIAQKKGAAVLLADDAALARSLKADGIHLSWSKEPVRRYHEARETLGAHAIIGADAGRSRHDAMELGEAGADYVAFGIPGHVEDLETARGRQHDLVSWWSEIFEIPCVAIDVAAIADARELHRSGADFVAVGLPNGTAAEAASFVTALAASASVKEAT